jgi:tRNA A-37 threonylcarbamoyl transferase component Bud32
VSTQELEQTLRDLPNVGTLIKDRGYRQVWRFEFGGKAYFLKFYPRGGIRDRWRRTFRGSPALREFQRLQWLQKAKIPSPRAVAYLAGYNLSGRKGDAVILQAIEPSVPLDQLLNDQALAGEYPSRERRKLADQVIDLVHRLGASGYGHDDLHLGNFLLHEGKLHLIDAYAVRKGGLRVQDVMMLGASVGRFATTTDMLRGWRKLVIQPKTSDSASPAIDREELRRESLRMPRANTASTEIWESQLERINGDNRYFGRVSHEDWSGVFFRTTKYPRRWSQVSNLEVTREQWEAALPPLLEKLQAGQLQALKTSKSGDVFATTLSLGGRDVEVVIKRPRRRYWYRYLNEIGRGARARRAWKKAWHLVVRDLPTAWPIAFFERRSLGYVVETFLVSERVPGPTLWKIDLDALTAQSREMIFRRTGRILRLLEQYGFAHFDAKASNWIIRPDEKTGPAPILIDVDGVRQRRWPALGIQRLLRSLGDRRQYNREDSLALCLGYAPYAPLSVEQTIE